MFACADIDRGIEPSQTFCGKLIKAIFEEAADSGNTVESDHTEKQVKKQKGGL